jgi:hypothetical protein
MKILIPALVASFTAITAIAATAGATTCSSVGTTAWTTPARCPAPNQNRGASQGAGVIGFPSRVLSVQLSVDTGNVLATAQGFSQTGKIITACKITASPGQFNTTGPNICQGGNFHKLSVQFN